MTKVTTSADEIATRVVLLAAARPGRAEGQDPAAAEVGYAESLPALSRWAHRHTRYVIEAADWRHAVGQKGPVTLDRSEHFDTNLRLNPWAGQRALRVMLASDVAAGDPLVAERLLSVAQLPEVIVEVPPSYPLDQQRDEHVGVLAWELRDASAGFPGPWQVPPHMIIRSSLEPSTERAADLYPSYMNAIAALLGNERNNEASPEDFALELASHQSDIFVTSNEAALARRFGDAYPLLGHSVFSPWEALHAVELHLRIRGRFVPRIDARDYHEVDAVHFYSALGRSLLPDVVHAISSCLSPPSVAALRPVADALLAVMARLDSLLIAQDRLSHLHYLERHLGGGNNLLLEQTYHVQQSVALTAGILDGIARAICALDGHSPDKEQATWTRLSRARVRWVTHLADSNAQSMRDAAHSHPQRDAMDLVYRLRNANAHDQQLALGLVDFQDTNRVTMARFSALDLTDFESQSGVLDDMQGLIAHGRLKLAVPHRYQIGLVTGVTDLVNHVAASANWPHHDWWLADSQARLAMESDARLEREVRWLFPTCRGPQLPGPG